MTTPTASILFYSKLEEALKTLAFNSFVRLYVEAFPESNEQQDPQQWLAPPQPGEPETLIAIARNDVNADEHFEVWGGLVAQYFPQSQSALLAYVVVDPGKRRLGIGRQLIVSSIDALTDLAHSRDQELKAVFAEAEDFRLSEIEKRGTMPQSRMIAHDRYGARWIPISYVMPRLSEATRRDPHLLLMTLPHPKVTLNSTTLPLSDVESFLAEYYKLEAENLDDVRRGDEVERMRTELEALATAYHTEFGWPRRGSSFEDTTRDLLQVPLSALPLPVEPAMQLHDVAVCLHFVTVKKGKIYLPEPIARVGRSRIDSEEYRYKCPIYHSHEIDILSYRFHNNPPIESICKSETQFRVRICFPTNIDYSAEGLKRELVGARSQLDVRVSLSASWFRETEVQIWHLAILPLFDATFTELDVIRLTALYYNEQEETDLLETTTFALDDGIKMLLPDLLLKLSGGCLYAKCASASTIEFNPSAGKPPETRDLWKRILSALYLTTKDDQEGFRQLEEFYDTPEVERQLNACCGIVTGHFDYRRMSFAEMQDTLAPASAAGSYAIWLNHASLVNIDLNDEMLERCGRTIGISPYLILPHAVLLHNEFVVDWAEEVAFDAIKDDEPYEGSKKGKNKNVADSPHDKREALTNRLEKLANARRLVEHCLYRAYVPNIFHYPGERELYEVGSRTRGALDKKQTLEWRYKDLTARLRDGAQAIDEAVKSEQANAERWRGFILTVVSVLLSLTVVLDVVVFFSSADNRQLLWPPTGWTVASGVVALLCIIALIIARPSRRDD